MMHGFVWFLRMRSLHYEMCGLCRLQGEHCFLCDVHIRHVMRCWRHMHPVTPPRKNGDR